MSARRTVNFSDFMSEFNINFGRPGSLPFYSKFSSTYKNEFISDQSFDIVYGFSLVLKMT
jgi:hypothetical protein